MIDFHNLNPVIVLVLNDLKCMYVWDEDFFHFHKKQENRMWKFDSRNGKTIQGEVINFFNSTKYNIENYENVKYAKQAVKMG